MALAFEPAHAAFDVVCAGEARWRRHGMRFKPAGVVRVARLLARGGLRIGLATLLDDDAFGRTSLERIAASGIDVGGVTLVRAGTGLVLVDAEGSPTRPPPGPSPERGLEVPEGWASQVFLVSGLSPVTSMAGALCRAARRARRAGSIVVVDASANLRVWTGRDPRTTSTLLREADVVRGSLEDFAVIGMDSAMLRSAMRPSAVLVLCNAQGATATGPFGEVQSSFTLRDEPDPRGADACTAAICAELARAKPPDESEAARWHRVLRRWTGA